MRIGAGGVKELGFTYKDLQNHIQRRRRKMLQHGAAEFLLNYLSDQKASNKGFFSKIKVDNAQIETVFWATARMRMDYKCFGDCVSFDTTYRTNDESRPLGITLLLYYTWLHYKILYRMCYICYVIITCYVKYSVIITCYCICSVIITCY
ncbi:Protein FAR1-RELATED SEQUENCE 5 [Linum grandiflorum]